jgi:hypothetical protein
VHDAARRIAAHLVKGYSPKYVEEVFSEVGPEFIGYSSPLASVVALANWRG